MRNKELEELIDETNKIMFVRPPWNHYPSTKEWIAYFAIGLTVTAILIALFTIIGIKLGLT